MSSSRTQHSTSGESRARETLIKSSTLPLSHYAPHDGRMDLPMRQIQNEPPNNSKTCLKRPFKYRQNKGLNDKG